MNDATKAPERILAWSYSDPWDNELRWWSPEDEEGVILDGTEPQYILATPAALAASPEVAALIREAEARGMERAANMVALAPLAHLPHSPGAVAFFSDPTATLNDAATAIRAEAAALRGEKEPK